jgi:hypothetical protein
LLHLMLTEAESTVSKAQLLDDDGQSVKSSIETEFSGTTEERGYRQGAGKILDQSSRSL